MTVQDLLKEMNKACTAANTGYTPKLTVFLGRKSYIQIMGDVDVRPYVHSFPLKFNGADLYIVNVDNYLKVIAE